MDGVAELMMSFLDVAFQPSKASFSTTCLKCCGRGESLGTIACLITVVGGKQGHAACKILWLHEASFLCQSNLMKIMKLLTMMK